MNGLKTGLINVDGNQVEMFMLEEAKDVTAFFKEFPEMKVTSLEPKFKQYIKEGDVIILPTTRNRAGFFSWLTEGEENFNRIEA